MVTITRNLPESNPKRLLVLTTAKEKKDGLPPAQNIFTPNTTTRLDAIQPLFATALDGVRSAKGDSIHFTEQKNNAGKILRMFCSHYLQVFNFGVERGVYPKAARAFFGLDTETGALPDMKTDGDAEQVGKNIATGEADLLSATLPAMSNPSAAEVATALATFKTQLTKHSNGAQALDTEQEAVDALVPEADKVIKKIYDEAEARYNEEEPESQRADCRWWGVQYKSIGDETTLTVQIKHASDHSPYPGLIVRLTEAAGKRLTTNENGEVVFITTLTGEATIDIFELTGSKEPDYSRDIDITEGVPQTVVIEI